MEKLTQTKRNLISSAAVTFKDRKILILDGVRGRAFETFKAFLIKKNAPIEREEVIFFKDLTLFGGGEEGVLITDKHFYYYQWGFRQIAIADISEVLIGGLFDENIVFALKSGHTVSIWLSKLFQEIKAVIAILQTDDVAFDAAKSQPVQVQCLGCKAIVRREQNICDYCRSPLPSC